MAILRCTRESPLYGQTTLAAKALANTLTTTPHHRTTVPTPDQLTQELVQTSGRISDTLALNINALVDKIMRKKIAESLPRTPSSWESFVKNADNAKVHRPAVGPESKAPTTHWVTVCGWDYGQSRYQKVVWKHAFHLCGTCFPGIRGAKEEE